MIHFPFLQQFFTLSNLLIALATHISSPSLHSTKMLHKIKWPEQLFLFFFLFLLLEDIWLGSVLHSSMGCMASYLRVLLLLIGLVSFFSHFNFFFLLLSDFAGAHFFQQLLLKECKDGKYFILCISEYVFILCSSLNDILRVNIILLHHFKGVTPSSFNLQCVSFRSQCYSRP